MSKKLKVGLIALVGAFAILTVAFSLSLAKDNDPGYTAAPVTHDGISFELVGSESIGDTHTFHFDVKNVDDHAVRLSSIFAIKNEGKRYRAEDVAYSDSELNPNMDGTISVTFKMNGEDLAQGNPKLTIDRGLILNDIIEIELTKQ